MCPTAPRAWLRSDFSGGYIALYASPISFQNRGVRIFPYSTTPLNLLPWNPGQKEWAIFIVTRPSACQYDNPVTLNRIFTIFHRNNTFLTLCLRFPSRILLKIIDYYCRAAQLHVPARISERRVAFPIDVAVPRISDQPPTSPGKEKSRSMSTTSP